MNLTQSTTESRSEPEAETTITETELAEQLGIEPILVLYFTECEYICADHDELGLLFTPSSIHKFEIRYPTTLREAQQRSERMARIRTARKCLDVAASS